MAANMNRLRRRGREHDTTISSHQGRRGAVTFGAAALLADDCRLWR